MTAHDRVDGLVEGLRQVNDFAIAVGRAIAIAEGADVTDDDDVVSAAGAQSTGKAVDDRCGLEEAKVTHIGRTRRRWRGNGREPDDADPERAANDQRIAANPWHVASIGIANIRAEDSVARVAHARP
jgi:hypothetical protein